MAPPIATMRLQFRAEFTFDHAREQVPYLKRLGVSHIYASPIQQARRGSTHGYDMADPTRISAELGGEEGLRRLVHALRAAGMGLIVDIVPNHIAVGGGETPTWLDVLEHGENSRYAAFFDIDWRPSDPTLRGKVLLPFLGRPYAEALRDGEIVIGANPLTGRPAAIHGPHVWPIRPEDQNEVEALGASAFDGRDPEGGKRLHALLERQHFQASWWRSANDRINWRRFFDVSELAALRAERDDAFEHSHALMLRLYAEGVIDGFRVDHVDGLTDPEAYCRRLRARLDALRERRPASVGREPAWLVVEKILARRERLPAAWPAHGTTGYEFMNEVSALQHDAAGEARLSALWREAAGEEFDFDETEKRARDLVLDSAFASQFEALVDSVFALLREDPETRDWGRPPTRRLLARILCEIRAYRGYPGKELTDGDRAAHRAVSVARRALDDRDAHLLDAIAAIILARGPAAEGVARARARFQQLCAPLAAKAVEDTAFYRYGRAIARNDVGFDPGRLASDIGSFHRFMQRRRHLHPHAMSSTATHDHKRGEDVRARLAVLSEWRDWPAVLKSLLARSDPLLEAGAPDAADRVFLFQMIVGGWPPDLSLDDAEGCETLRERLGQWQEKALREAKRVSSWRSPDLRYEGRCAAFLKRLFNDRSQNGVLSALVEAAETIAPAGATNGLAQLALRVLAPGAPDAYQGCDLWDFSFVDPDNRRPVDWRKRAASLDVETPLSELVVHWRDGRVKQALLARLLSLRHSDPALFAEGDYRPVIATGAGAEHVVSFARTKEDRALLAVAPRTPFALLPQDAQSPLIPPAAWGDSALPLSGFGGEWRDALTGRSFSSASAPRVGDLLSVFPIAVLLRVGASASRPG